MSGNPGLKICFCGQYIGKRKGQKGKSLKKKSIEILEFFQIYSFITFEFPMSKRENYRAGLPPRRLKPKKNVLL